jgi:hypothetical protein
MLLASSNTVEILQQLFAGDCHGDRRVQGAGLVSSVSRLIVAAVAEDAAIHGRSARVRQCCAC